MKRLFAVALTLMLSTSSAWADWQLLKETREYILYLDPDTVQKNGSLLKAVSFQDFHKMQMLAEHAYLGSKTLNEFDCEKKQLRQVEFSIFPENMGSGGALFTENKIQDWMSVQAGSPEETIWNKVCGKN